MRFLKKLLAVIAGFTAVAFFLSFFITPKWSVARTIQIASSVDVVFPYLNSLEKWSEWTVWNKSNYPEMIITYQGIHEGAGAIQNWRNGNDTGRVEITASQPPEYVNYRLQMDNDAYRMEGQLLLRSGRDGTEVTWTLWGDSENNLLARLMMLIYRPAIGKDFDESLKKLKTLIEKNHIELSKFYTG